jgi:DNA-binding transcriptional regulator of glucitol operon
VRRFLSPRWLLRHLVTIVLVAGCLSLGWWQIGRAAGGNALSFGYACEWPVFALFVVFIWYREVRAELRRGDERDDEAPIPEKEQALLTAVPARSRPAVLDDDDPQLRAYNDYLAWLNADPSRRPADYPGRAVESETRPA